MLGVTFVENQDAIFHHKKSFLQDIQCLMEKEFNYLVKMKKRAGADSARQSVQLDNEPSFGLSMAQIDEAMNFGSSIKEDMQMMKQGSVSARGAP